MQEQPPVITPMILKYFLLLLLIAVVLLGRILWPFLSVLIFSFLLTSVFQPVYDLLHKRLSAGLSSLLTCILIVGLVFIPLMLFAAALSREAFALYQLGKTVNLGLRLKELLEHSLLVARIHEFLAAFDITFEPQSLGKSLSSGLRASGLFLFNQASAWATNIMMFVFDFMIMIITIYFLLIDQDRLLSYTLRLSPLPDDQERRLIHKFKEIAGAVIIGNGICSVIQGVLGGLSFIVFGLGSPVIWGGVMMVLAFLPIFGIGLVLIPAGIIMLLNGNIAGGVFMLIFYACLSFSVEYLLKPKLVGRKAQIHTLLIFLGILGGLSVFGVLGIVYGPLIVAGFQTLADIYLVNYDRFIKSGECRG